MSDETIDALREALRLSPENGRLRRHLAEVLLERGRAAEAEQEFRQALALDPANDALKLGLAGAFCYQGKNSEALVLVEALMRRPDAPPKAYVLHARLLLRAGETERAVAQYKEGLSLDPALEDKALSEELGVGAPEDSPRSDGRERVSAEEPPPEAEQYVERPSISFKDVGGMEKLKEEIRMKIIYPLMRPEVYRMYGKPVGGGILLYGPPGCGKTHLARATAGEVKAGFLAVGIHDVLDMWIGRSERNLHQVFEHARRHAPCVLFFDEVDALGASRADMRHSAGRQLINQFLAELDGMQASNEGVLILGATNAPWHLDAAFRRPGRFDRILFVPPPDLEARAAILRIHLEGKPMQEMDAEHVAKKTESFSGADLKAAIDLAVEAKLREAMRSGAPVPLTTKDLTQAAAALKPSTQEWFGTARNYAVYSNQSGMYDDILQYLRLR